MPTISEFYGIIIRIYFMGNEHNPPHFHAIYGKLTDVQPLQDLKLRARFEDGEERVYDVAQLLDTLPVFSALTTTPGLFQQVRVDVGGYGIVWNDDLDLDSAEIYNAGQRVQ